MSSRPGGASRAGEPALQSARADAVKTIEVFSAGLRQEVDLDTLSTELLAVVDQTMEPTRVWLWLRPSPGDSSGTPRSEARPTPWAY
jgi:hypothetical protein